MARPRKLNVIRDRNGKSRGEPEVIAPEVLAVRIRQLAIDGLTPEHAKDALAGFTLGRLLLRWRADRSDPSGINQAQYDAGDAWGAIVRRHASIMGYRLNIHSPSFIMVGGGRDCVIEPDKEVIRTVRREWKSCYDGLMKACVDHGVRVRDVTYGICIENWPAATLTTDDYGSLRTGLNALSRVLK